MFADTARKDEVDPHHPAENDSITRARFDQLLAALLADGRVTPVIDRRYSLGEVAEALQYMNEGHARAKVAISV